MDGDDILYSVIVTLRSTTKFWDGLTIISSLYQKLWWFPMKRLKQNLNFNSTKERQGVECNLCSLRQDMEKVLRC